MKSFLNSRKLTVFLFFVYLFILTWVIVAKMDWNLLLSSNISWINNPRVLLYPGVTWRTINLVPYRFGNFDIVEVLLNIIFFIPFSFYIKILYPKSSGLSAIILGFILSLIYESTQYILTIGFPDITDLIDNTLGACIGVIIINIIFLIFKEKLRLYMNFILILLSGYIIYEIINIVS